tara:strand:+ start:422 stop:649 length:228 start_codon:yes stop_codon:yes gene_type:complete
MLYIIYNNTSKKKKEEEEEIFDFSALSSFQEAPHAGGFRRDTLIASDVCQACDTAYNNLEEVLAALFPSNGGIVN